MEKTFECTFCDKTFRRQHSLDMHLRIHTGERPFSCSFCSKAFHQLAGLLQHTRLHTGERPYKCSFCTKTFNQKCHVDQHTRIHTGEMPYKCTLCDKAFRQKSNLDQHIATIHFSSVRGTFACSYCNKTFTLKKRLDRHVKTHFKSQEKMDYNQFFSGEDSLKQQLRHQADVGPSDCEEKCAIQSTVTESRENNKCDADVLPHFMSELSYSKTFDEIITIKTEPEVASGLFQ